MLSSTDEIITAMVQDEDEGRLVGSLMREGYRATKVSSTGGFLRRGNSTIIVGVEDSQVDTVIGIVKECCRKRKQIVNLDPGSAVAATSETIVPPTNSGWGWRRRRLRYRCRALRANLSPSPSLETATRKGIPL